MCFKDKMFSVYQTQWTGYKDKGQKQNLAWQQKHEFSTINDTDRFNKGSSILDLEGVKWNILALPRIISFWFPFFAPCRMYGIALLNTF